MLIMYHSTQSAAAHWQIWILSTSCRWWYC